jgi:hypothetical protein
MVERLLHTYEYVDVPYDDVTQLLAADAAGVLQSATDTAVEHAEDVTARLSVEVGGLIIGRDIEIEVGAFEPVGITHVRIPLRWHAREAETLFPSMDANLVVRMVPVEYDRTQIVFDGSYEPPLGLLGAAADAAVGHHVAEAAVDRFVKEVAARIEATAMAS